VAQGVDPKFKTQYQKKVKVASQAWYCTPVIPALKAAAGGSQVQDQPWLHSKTLSLKKRKKERKEESGSLSSP
jgi:hypothetical protein